MTTLKVDNGKCIGCGLCASICPDAFEMGNDAKARVKDVNGCKKCDCKSAADSCPVQAIAYTK
jgi:ferredoxin